MVAADLLSQAEHDEEAYALLVTLSRAHADPVSRGLASHLEALPRTATGKLLTVDQAAERLGTSVRFPRRLIAERRITFVRVGRHVRIPESALDALIEAGTVQPVARRRRPGRGVA